MTTLSPDMKRIHFVGVAGIGMSALARLLRTQGLKISGCDRDPGEIGRALIDEGIPVDSGHSPDHLDGVDLVVATSAARPDTQELQAARDRDIPIWKRSELLAAVMNGGRGIAVAGTHGKTTTTALVGWLLTHAGYDPTVLVGGVSANFASNARVGRPDLVVGEADEYDGSFLRLHPAIGVVTNVEPEHLDFYGTSDQMMEAYKQFVSQVTEHLVLCADDVALGVDSGGEVESITTYGVANGDLRACDITDKNGFTSFDVEIRGSSVTFRTPLSGLHNVKNCLAAIAVALHLGASVADIQEGIASFRGVQRRMEIIGDVEGVLVVDDYGHHPTEIVVTLDALKERYQRPIRLVFQPHTFSRTAHLLDDFSRAFSGADSVYLLDIYAARERDTLGMTGEKLASVVSRNHPQVAFVGSLDRARDAVLNEVKPGDLVVTMGAGDITRLAPRIVAGLGQ